MLNVAFLWIFSRGIELGVIVLCLLPIRALLRKKVPRIFSYLLWGALPVNIVYNLCMSFVPFLNRQIADFMDEKRPVEICEGWLKILKWAWSVGNVVIILGMMMSYFIFYTHLVGSIRWKENIYLNSRIRSPFTIGVFHSKIYLPMSVDEQYYEPVILHERVHIQRKDIWMKYLAVAFLAVFWFQPMLWLCYPMFINDMEEACDETVLRRKGKAFCTEYAKALLEVADQSEKVRGIAIGYGNGELKARIKQIVNYKEPRKKVRVAAMIGCILFMVIAIPISWQVPRMVTAERIESTRKTTLGIQEEDTETMNVSGSEQ